LRTSSDVLVRWRRGIQEGGNVRAVSATLSYSLSHPVTGGTMPGRGRISRTCAGSKKKAVPPPPLGAVASRFRTDAAETGTLSLHVDIVADTRGDHLASEGFSPHPGGECRTVDSPHRGSPPISRCFALRPAHMCVSRPPASEQCCPGQSPISDITTTPPVAGILPAGDNECTGRLRTSSTQPGNE